MEQKQRKLSQKTTKLKWQTETNGKRNYGAIDQPENKEQQSSYTNNQSRCKCIEFTNQKTQSIWRDYKIGPNYMMPPGDSPQP